jgi:putative transposase
MLRREGFTVNHKRVERIYRAEGLSLRQRQKCKRLSHLRVLRPLSTGTNQIWAMDFIHDSLWSGRRYRALASGQRPVTRLSSPSAEHWLSTTP